MIFKLKLYPGRVQLLIQDVFLMSIEGFQVFAWVRHGEDYGEYEDSKDELASVDPFEILNGESDAAYSFKDTPIFRGIFDISGHMIEGRRRRYRTGIWPSERKLITALSTGGLDGHLLYSVNQKILAHKEEAFKKYTIGVHLDFASSFALR